MQLLLACVLALAPKAGEPAPSPRHRAIVRMNEGVAAFEKKDEKAAETAMREAIALDATLPEAQLNLARLLRRAGLHAEAASAARLGLEHANPRTEPGLHYELGVALTEDAEGQTSASKQRAMWRDAVKHLRAAIVAEPQKHR